MSLINLSIRAPIDPAEEFFEASAQSSGPAYVINENMPLGKIRIIDRHMPTFVQAVRKFSNTWSVSTKSSMSGGMMIIGSYTKK